MMSPGGEDAFFAMDFDTLSQHQSQEIPFGVAHLDFGARNGSGVVGPKIDIVDGGRQSDKFEVKEGGAAAEIAHKYGQASRLCQGCRCFHKP